MGYRYYNPNPLGKTVGDCVIRSIAKLTGDTWDEIYQDLADKGFEMCDMPSSNSVWSAYLQDRGFTRHSIPDYCPGCYTVEDFCWDHPYGKYLLALSGHVVSVDHGNYYDSWDSGKEIPVFYWKKEE